MSPEPPATLPPQPLAGVRVLDVSGPIGAYATKLLADLGADVLLVEPPEGDPLRRTPPFKDGATGPDASLAFAYYHAGKRGTVLDVTDDANLGRLRDLAARADVVVISPSRRARLAGFDERARSLSWAHADAIVCAITPFGLDGPSRRLRATPFVSYAMSGDMHHVGPPEGPPIAVPARLSWDEACIHATICVLAALLTRRDVGGQVIDLSVHDVLCAKDFHFEQYDIAGKPVGGRQIGVGYPPTGTWACADGMIDIAAHQTAHWDAFLTTLGNPEALRAPSLHDALVRRQVFDGLIDVIGHLLADERRHDVVDRGQAAGLPCAVLNTPAQFVGDAQLAARDFFVTVTDPTLGELRLPGRPVASSAEMFRPGRRAPRLAEHDGEEFAAQDAAAADRTKPLSGTRVLSFGAFVAGNTSALALAELGADVVKIEARARPEVLRMPAYAYGRVVDEPSGVTNTVLHAGLSRGSRNLSLDMHTEQGRDLFRRLVAEADVVIENFGSPATMASWGCGYDALRVINPGIVMLSLSGYGRTGPRASHRAYATNISCFIGLTHTWGHTHGTLTDYLCSAHGVVGVLAGLALAARTGEGTYVDAAQIETAAVAMAPLLLEPLVNGRDVGPSAKDVPAALLSGVFRCAGDDRWVAVELVDLDDWAALCELLERPELVVTAVDDAPRRRGPLEAALAAWAMVRSPHTAALLLQHAGLAAGAVQDVEDLARDPSVRARGLVVEVEQLDLGVIEYAQSPYRMTKTPGRYRRPGPRLGEHTTEVLHEWLGMSNDDVAALRELGAVFVAPTDRFGGATQQ